MRRPQQADVYAWIAEFAERTHALPGVLKTTLTADTDDWEERLATLQDVEVQSWCVWAEKVWIKAGIIHLTPDAPALA